MKRYYFQILLACCLTLFAGCSDSDSESGQNGIPKGSKAIDLQQDRSGLLRNPCMGWGLYDDAVGNVANAEEYWAAQDEAAPQLCIFLLYTLALVGNGTGGRKICLDLRREL